MNHPNAPLQGVPLQPPPRPQSSSTQASQHQLPQPSLHSSTQSRVLPSQQPYSHLPITTSHQQQPLHPTTQPQFISSQPSHYAPPNILHQPDQSFYAHPSPYSTHSATGSYTSSDPNEAMAQAAMSRQTYPPISSYHTPQSNSPASIHSPHDASGRPMYAMPPMTHSMYYSNYPMHQTAYGHPAPPVHAHQSLPSSSGMMMQQQQAPTPQQHHATYQHASPMPHPQTPQQSGMIKTETSQPSLHRPVIAPPPMPSSSQQTPSASSQQQPTPQTPAMPNPQFDTLGSSAASNSGAAPGPIPATKPLVVKQDVNGVQWIRFEYSRDRVKMDYTIRCDVESVVVEKLSQEFKSANCVYPRACGGKDAYKGNRLQYESECNAVGWALAQLNPCLREKRGLIQRAVDSWRNSNQDPKLRSRRVRRQAKIQQRSKNAQLQTQPVPQGAAIPPSHQHMMQDGRPVSMMGAMPQTHHHHHGDNPSGREAGASEQFSSVSSTGQMAPSSHGLPSPAGLRYSQQFYPQYPQPPSMVASTMPSIHDSMGSISHHPTTTTLASASSMKEEDEETNKRALYGDVPDANRRKFILVDDTQRGTRVRVRVQLEQVKMDDMPDAHLRINSVYPRSYFSRQMRSPPDSPQSRAVWEDDEDSLPDERRGKTLVPMPLLEAADGNVSMLPVPRLTKSRRRNEKIINEMGYRMSWGQARTFSGRRLFLQRALDAYRNKTRHAMATSGIDAADAPHFETRAGKRHFNDFLEHSTASAASWHARGRRDSHAS